MRVYRVDEVMIMTETMSRAMVPQASRLIRSAVLVFAALILCAVAALVCGSQGWSIGVGIFLGADAVLGLVYGTVCYHRSMFPR